MRACPGQYENPAAASLPQNAKVVASGSPMGQRHLPGTISRSEHGWALCTGAQSMAAVSATGSPCVNIRRKRRRWLVIRGWRTRGGQRRAWPPAGLPGDRPSRWILPITALRVTPISAAIWLQVRPETTKLRSCWTRSGVQVAGVIDIGLAKMPRPNWAADRARARATGRRGHKPQTRNRCAPAPMAPRSPSRIRAGDCKLAVWRDTRTRD